MSLGLLITSDAESGPFFPGQNLRWCELYYGMAKNVGTTKGGLSAKICLWPGTPDETLCWSGSFPSMNPGVGYMFHAGGEVSNRAIIPISASGIDIPIAIKLWGDEESEPAWGTPNKTYDWTVDVIPDAYPDVQITYISTKDGPFYENGGEQEIATVRIKNIGTARARFDIKGVARPGEPDEHYIHSFRAICLNPEEETGNMDMHLEGFDFVPCNPPSEDILIGLSVRYWDAMPPAWGDPDKTHQWMGNFVPAGHAEIMQFDYNQIGYEIQVNVTLKNVGGRSNLWADIFKDGVFWMSRFSTWGVNYGDTISWEISDASPGGTYLLEAGALPYPRVVDDTAEFTVPIVIGEFDCQSHLCEFYTGPFQPGIEEEVHIAKIYYINAGNTTGNLRLALYEYPGTPNENMLIQWNIQYVPPDQATRVFYPWVPSGEIPYVQTWPVGIKIHGWDDEPEPAWGTPDKTFQWDIQTTATDDICSWIDNTGGPTNLTITDIFELIDSYLFEIPPTGYSFVPTLQNVFGVVDYYLGFNGDLLTGCNYFA